MTTQSPTPWSEAGRRQLESWGGLTVEDAAACSLFEVSDASEIYPDFRAEPAIVIPYFDPLGEPMTFVREGEELAFCRVRYLEPAVKRMFGGVTTAAKYGQPGRSGTRAYFCPLVDWSRIVGDVEEPLIITEGEAKGMVAAKHGLPTIALGGVYNFMDGAEDMLPELEAVKWRGRDQYTVFDSDVLTNPNVLAAEARLTDELVRKRGAKGYQVRLPAEGDEKEALDTFLATYGTDALVALLQSSPSLGALDAKVVSLNRSCAWIEREGMVYDLEDRAFVSKDNFVSGSRFSTLKHITVGGGQRSAPKSISVAATWLTHPHAQRYGEILFRPGLGNVVTGDTGRPALNMWNGWQAEYGISSTDRRVKAWLDLTAYLFSGLEIEDRSLPFKLMAYKAQNPMDKIPLAPVLIGDQGCGKSLWAECLAAAFNPYAVSIDSKEFDAEFQGWMERSVFAVINEAKANHLQLYGEALKALISDATRNMNEKFRPKRQIQSYTFYVLTANDRAVGAFALDDRRMIVVECPRKMTDPAGVALYTYLGKRRGTWHAEGGPAALMGFLLDYDLQGWTPPDEAPMTAEKHNAYRESLTAVQELANDMKVADGHSIEMWVDTAIGWAKEAEIGNNPVLANFARATLEGVKHLQIRPWYEPRELCLLFPHLINSVMGSKWDNSTLPGKVSRELRNAGVRFLKNKDDPRGFKYRGLLRQYLVVCDYEEWEPGLDQAQFDKLMGEFPSYGQRKERR